MGEERINGASILLMCMLVIYFEMVDGSCFWQEMKVDGPFN